MGSSAPGARDKSEDADGGAEIKAMKMEEIKVGGRRK
jgi:hypothetical protein